MMIQEQRENTRHLKLHFYVILLMLYFFIAPFEDVITSEMFGTLSKYVAMAFAFVAICFIIKKGKIVVNKIFLLPLLLTFMAWCSVLWSVDADRAIERNIAYMLLPALFMTVSLLDYNSKDLQQIEKAIVYGGIACLVISLWQYGVMGLFEQRLTLNERNDPNNLAALIYLPFCISISWLNSGYTRFRRINILVSILLFLFILATGSRGALLSSNFFVLVYYLLEIKGATKISIIKIMAFWIGATGIYFLASIFLPDTLFNRLFTMSSYESDQYSATSRSAIWKTIFMYIIPYFSLGDGILGIGSGNAPVLLETFFGMAKAVHNTYINIFLEYGILGFSCFLIFLYNIGKKLYTNKKMFCFACLMGELVIIFFLDSYPKKFFWNVLFYTIITLKCNDTENR